MTAAVMVERAPVGSTPARGRIRLKHWLTQIEAAEYLGVSDTWFRHNVHVAPKPVGMPRPGRKPVLRYATDDLDAWVAKCDQEGRGGKKP